MDIGTKNSPEPWKRPCLSEGFELHLINVLNMLSVLAGLLLQNSFGIMIALPLHLIVS